MADKDLIEKVETYTVLDPTYTTACQSWARKLSSMALDAGYKIGERFKYRVVIEPKE